MKTPTWATAIGIMMILFGGCSVMNDIKSITMPAMLEKQRGLVKEKMEEARANATDSLTTADSLAVAEAGDDAESFEEEQKKIEEIMTLPEFTKTWVVRFGYMGLFISAFYILGGVFLLVRRNFSIKLAYTVLVVSILFSGSEAGVLLSSSSSGVIALTTGLSQFVGIVIDIILLAVIFSSDKEAYVFSKNEPPR